MREWVLSFRDHSRVMIGYLKPMPPDEAGVRYFDARQMFMPALSHVIPQCERHPASRPSALVRTLLPEYVVINMLVPPLMITRDRPN